MDDTRAWLAAAISENSDFLASGMGRWIQAAAVGNEARSVRPDLVGDALVHLVDWLGAAERARIVSGRGHLAAIWGSGGLLPERAGSVACSALVELLRVAGVWDVASPDQRRAARELLERFFCDPLPRDLVRPTTRGTSG